MMDPVTAPSAPVDNESPGNQSNTHARRPEEEDKSHAPDGIKAREISAPAPPERYGSGEHRTACLSAVSPQPIYSIPGFSWI